MNENAQKAIQERFLLAVKLLNIRFPVAEISRETGYDAGTISPYLKENGKASTKFLEKFSEKFGVRLEWLKKGKEPIFESGDAPEIELMGLPTVTSSMAKEALSKKALGDKTNLHNMAMQVLGFYISSKDFIIEDNGQRITTGEASKKVLSDNAYAQAAEMLLASEKWVRVS